MRVCFLTESFLQQHKDDHQILQKLKRPYLIFERDSETYWAVPFRSNLSRSNACFDFSISDAGAHPGGLDFEKMVIVRRHDVDFSSHPAVDRISIRLVHKYRNTIIRKAKNFISMYSKAVKRFADKFDKPKYVRESALRYFHAELGLPDRQEITLEQFGKLDKLKTLAKKKGSQIHYQFAKSFMAKINSFDIQAFFGDVEAALRHTMRDLLSSGFSEKQVISTVLQYSPTLPSKKMVYRAIKMVENALNKHRRCKKDHQVSMSM